MADDTLNNPVEIQATHIDATLLPPNFGLSYRLYVLGQGMDLGKVAGKANESGKGAYDAQVKNDEQDVRIENLDSRVFDAEVELKKHEGKITSNEKSIADLYVKKANSSEVLKKNNNLSDLSNKLDARNNLGLGSSSVRNVGTSTHEYIPDMSSFSSLNDVPGYQKLPSGIIVQWGKVVTAIPSGGGAGIGIVTFPIAFSSMLLNIQLSRRSADPYVIYSFFNESISGFSAYTRQGDHKDANATLHWMAIGC